MFQWLVIRTLLSQHVLYIVLCDPTDTKPLAQYQHNHHRSKATLTRLCYILQDLLDCIIYLHTYHLSLQP